MPELEPLPATNQNTLDERIDAFVAERREELAQRGDPPNATSPTYVEDNSFSTAAEGLLTDTRESLASIINSATENANNSDESSSVGDCSCGACTRAATRAAETEQSLSASTKRDDRRTVAARRLP